MSENVAKGAAPRPRKCKRLSADQWASLTRKQRRDFHRFRMAARRERQIDREPNSRHRPSGSIAQTNRRGAPHKHTREIARRLRQAERRAAQAPPG